MATTLHDGRARRIATEWHDGTGPLTQFATTGAILDPPALRAEISANLAKLDIGTDRRELLALDRYVREVGCMRGPQPGWSHITFNYSTVTLEEV
jgi:hypothetical protein